LPVRYRYRLSPEAIPVPAPSIPLAAIRQPAFLYGADGRIVEANDRAEALAGRSLVGLSVAEKLAIFGMRRRDGSPIPFDDLPVSRALRGEEVVDEPLDVTAADGRTVHVLATTSPLRDGDAVIGALVVWQVVSALVRAREVQRQTQRDYQALLDHSLLAYARCRTLFDADGAPNDYEFVEVNEAYLAMTGLSDIVGRRITEVVPGMERDLIDFHNEVAMSGVSRQAEVYSSPLGRWYNVNVYSPAPGEFVALSRDITDRVQTEEALAESRVTLQGALRSMADAVFISDADGRFVEFNDAFVAYHRFGSRDECSHSFETCATLFDVWFGETGEPAPPERWAVSRALSGENGTGVEYVLRRRDTGETWTGLYNFAPLRDDAGAIIGSVVTARDVTDRKRAEASLRESEAKYRSIAELSPDAIVVHRRGVILYANNAAARLLRAAAPEALLGTDLLALVHPDDRASVQDRVDAAQDHGSTAPLREFRFLIDGAIVDVETTGGPVIWDGEPAVQVIMRDIGDRKRVEAALRMSERRLREVFENSRDAIYRLNIPTGQYEYISPSCEDIVGYSPGDLMALGREESLSMIHPDDLPAFRAMIEEVDMVGRGEAVYRQRTKDGEYRWISNRMALLRDEAGAPCYRIGSIRDITRRKEAELGLARYTRQLSSSNEELVRFAYVASHDLQEPLRSIVSFSQLLERRYKGQLDQDADEYIDFIVEGGMRMQQLIKDLLQVSRIETQAKPFEPTDAGRIVRDAVALLNGRLQEAGAAVTIGPMPAVMADAAQLEQVFSNLISNAIKYRKPEVPPVITVTARPLGPMVEVAVQDNGIGIEEEYFDRIFEMFRRLHTHDKYEGTGIGLAVVKRIVERHGGTVHVESTPGAGSTFFFTLPAA
jgi:PAS domain S-box-containing protein